MSKLQTAIWKLANTKAENRPDKQRQRTSAKQKINVNRNGEHREVSSSRRVDVGTSSLREEGIIVSDERSQELRDEIRRIKRPVIENAFGKQSAMIPNGNIVMVTSATAGEGKTFTTMNLAMSIAAERDVNVILVDADIAKPHVSKLFGLTESSGIIDFLAGEITDVSELIVDTDISGLSVIPAGRADEFASELIASKVMSDFISQLDALLPNTVILFDTSPVMQTNEPQVLTRLAGQVLFVVAANTAHQEAVIEAVSLLGDDLIVNVIFNRVQSLFRQKYRYGGYYGYQSRR